MADHCSWIQTGYLPQVFSAMIAPQCFEANFLWLVFAVVVVTRVGLQQNNSPLLEVERFIWVTLNDFVFL